ncbi:hypothetical protein ACTXT7_009889 [Hymenolepis weldensis]
MLKTSRACIGPPLRFEAVLKELPLQVSVHSSYAWLASCECRMFARGGTVSSLPVQSWNYHR